MCRWRTRPARPGGSRGGRRCRCSTRITRCGSGSCWVIPTIRAACWPRQVAYWRGALAGVPAELALPADRPRPAVAGYRGHAVPVEIPPGLHARLAGLARAHGVDAVHGGAGGGGGAAGSAGGRGGHPGRVPIAGRADEGLDGLVGFFVNTLVLRTDVSGDPSFAELLGRVQGDGAGCAGASGCAVREAGGGAGAGAVAGAASAVPGDGVGAEQRPGGAGPAGGAAAGAGRGGGCRPGSTWMWTWLRCRRAGRPRAGGVADRGGGLV